MTKLFAVITCPECKGTTPETMPVNQCVHMYECPHCGAILQARRGQCCVFCSYADVLCPSCQVENTCEVLSR